MNLETDKTNSKQSKREVLKSFEKLIDNIKMLKDKEEGCPWHKNQNHESLIPYLIEESYEFINATENGSINNMKDELGDILLQIMLHAEISSEKKEFDLKDIISNLNHKIELRHPYIFSNKRKVSIEEASQIWEAIKTSENTKSNENSISSYLTSQLQKISPAEGTEKIAIEMKNHGFKWNNVNQVLSKVNEEFLELKEAISKYDKQHIEEELGDILFTLINLSLFLEINHQNALRSANKKFLKRFSIMENMLNDRIIGNQVKDFQKLWQLAKKQIHDSEIKNYE